MSVKNNTASPIKVRIEVDEPWNFDVGNGKNFFYGTFWGEIKFDNSNKYHGDEYLVVKVDKSFTWDKKLIDYIIVSPRFVGGTISDIFKKKELIVAISLIKDKNILNTRTFSFKQVDYFAIGAISLLNKKISLNERLRRWMLKLER